MVRKLAKSIADTARKAVSRAPASPDEKPVTKKAAGEKAATKKAAAKKTAATKKAATKKAVAKKTGTSPAKSTANNVPRKKASPAKLAVKDGETKWTKRELDQVLTELGDDRARLHSLVTEQERDLASLMRDAGDGAGHDQADMGATSFERDQELTVVHNEKDMLAQIERALERIDDGTYGVCESCGNPIGKMRVMAFPRATLCMTCKQREERR